MNIQMVAHEFSLTPSLREYLDRRLQAAFSRMRGKAANVVVRLRDLNGPRGGCDKVCQLSVEVPGRPSIQIREVQENMYHAIDCAVKRAAFRLTRTIRSSRTVSRHVVAAELGDRAAVEQDAAPQDRSAAT